MQILAAGPWPPGLEALQGGGHPSLPIVRGCGSLPDERHLIVYDDLSGEPLGAPGDPVPERTWMTLVAQLLEGLEYIHRLGWVHGDLGPAAVVRRGDRVIFIDPGAMLRSQAPSLTGAWRAPELAEGDRPTVASDLFSAGVLAATLASGQLPRDGALGPHDSVACPLSPAATRWLSGLLRADPALRPATTAEALRGLEEAVERDLQRASATLARLTSVGPVGRQELVGRLAAAAASGGLGIVLGDQDSGRSAVLSAVHHRLRRSGRRAEVIELGADPVRSHRALRTLLADATGFTDRPPVRELSSSALAAGLRSYEAALVAATESLLTGDQGPFLFDDVDAATLAGRVLVAALERCPSPGALITTDGASQRAMEALVSARGDSRDLPAVLSPLHGEQIAKWLHQALGPVAQPFGLAELLRAETDGLPGLVIGQVGLLLERGALTRGELDWRWSEDLVLPLLGGVTQPMRSFPRRSGTPEDHLQRVLESAERATAAADPRAALTLLQSELTERPLEDLPASSLAPVWARMAHLAMVVNQPSVAARWLAALRVHAPDPDPERRAARIVEEARALRGSGQWRQALALLNAHQQAIDSHGDPDTERQAWATLAACHLKAGAIDAAEAAVAALEAAADDDRDWLVRTAALRARLELRAGRAHAAADACTRTLARLGEHDHALRATLSSTLGTAWLAVGRREDAVREFSSARALFVSEGMLTEAARVANKLGLVRFEGLEWDQARADWESFLDLARRAADPWEQCCALNNLGELYRDTGHLDRAAEALEEGLRLARRHALAPLEPLAMSNLAQTWGRMGDIALAADAMQEARTLAEARGLAREAADVALRLALLRLDQGHLPAARALVTAIETGPAKPDRRLRLELDALAALLGVLGDGAQEGDESRALESIRALAEAGAPASAARLRVRLAEALVGLGRYGPAETLLDDADELLRPLDARPDLSRIEEARRHLASATRTSLQTLTRHHDWLQELTLALSRERQLEPLVELILDRALRLVGEHRGLVRLFDERGVASMQIARHVAARDSGTHPVLTDAAEPPGPAEVRTTSIIARVVRTRQPLRIPDLSTDPEYGDPDATVDARPGGAICVPILRAEDLLGVIYVDGPGVAGADSGMKAGLLMACADAASVAVENARLIEALKRKQDALAIMAHELRTPITSIIGFASLLLSPDEDRSVGEDTEMLGLIRSEAERVREMVGRVLELARMQAGDAEWRKDPVDALVLVVAAVDSLRSLARQSEVHLTGQAEEDLPDLVGDEQRLIQVMVNLVGNALKFVPFGGHVDVSASVNAGGVLIQVQDDGPGIPTERLSRIFEPWQQAGSVRMRRKGVGLGLAISQAIVQRHGGWITAENRDEGGARFTVWLPGFAAEASPAPSHLVAPHRAGSAQTDVTDG